MKAAITILNQARIYAMSVKGIFLTQKSKAELKSYLAVYNGKNWIYINPRTGRRGTYHKEFPSLAIWP